jgi:hypothetical protein
MVFATTSRYMTLWGPFNFIVKTYKVWFDKLEPVQKFIFLIVHSVFLLVSFYFIFRFADHLLLLWFQ